MRTNDRLRAPIGMRHCCAVMTAVLVLGAAGRAGGAPPPCVAGPEPPRDINGYVLFAYTDLYVKGGTAAIPGRGLFTGGHLGSNGIATVGDPNATLGTNYGVYLSDGNAAVADRITLGPGHPLLPTSVWDLFTNAVDNADFTPSSVRNAGPICFAPPIIGTGLPSFVAFTHPDGPYQPVLPGFPSEAALNALADVNLPAGFSLNLAPGDYGDIDLNDGCTLNLGAGVYNLHSLQTGRNVTINTTAGTEVRIAVDFRSNNDLVIQGSDLARFYIRSDGVGPSTFSFTLGYNTDPSCTDTIAVHGQFFVPNGRINLGDCTNIFGRVWADVVRNDTNINVTYRAGAALRGTKYLDADADGQIDPGESGLAGITFYVDYDDDGVLDPGEPFGMTGATGAYAIVNIAAGTWKVREVGQPGWTCSFPTTADTFGCYHEEALVSGSANPDNDFGNWFDGLGHFQCYEIHRPAFDRAGVSLVDALGASTVTIKRAKRICAPADKNGEDPTAPGDSEHFTYYTIKQTTRFTKVKGATVANQFGTYTMALTKPDRMLVPTAKSLTDPATPLTRPIDHYKCYKVAGAKTKVRGLVMTDQFGTIVVDVKRPLHLCLPALKNDEGPLVDPATALMCYKVTGQPPAFRPELFTLNQFGPDAYDFFGPRDLCVPSTVTLP